MKAKEQEKRREGRGRMICNDTKEGQILIQNIQERKHCREVGNHEHTKRAVMGLDERGLHRSAVAVKYENR